MWANHVSIMEQATLLGRNNQSTISIWPTVWYPPTFYVGPMISSFWLGTADLQRSGTIGAIAAPSAEAEHEIVQPNQDFRKPSLATPSRVRHVSDRFAEHDIIVCMISLKLG